MPSLVHISEIKHVNILTVEFLRMGVKLIKASVSLC